MRSRQAGPEYQIEMIPNDVGKQFPATILIPANDLVNCIATSAIYGSKILFAVISTQNKGLDQNFFFSKNTQTLVTTRKIS